MKLCQAVFFKVQQELIAKSKDGIITTNDIEDVFKEYGVFLNQ